jgi:ankyrin repeat protein
MELQVLCVAAQEGDLQAVAAWLDEGGGVDERCSEHEGATLLFAAAYGGQGAMVRMLLARGASVNLHDFHGITALMAAANQGHTAIVQALLDAKADASLQDENGCTAMRMAHFNKHTTTAQVLREHAEPQAAEAEAGVAMHAAASTAPTPNLSGRRVRLAGLKGRPELNGRSGVAGRFDAAKGRYEVAVEGEAEAVLLKPANLQQEALEPAQSENPNPSPSPNRNPRRNPMTL